MKSIFISYAHEDEDEAVAQEVYKLLLNHDLNPWLDKEKLVPGQEWKIEIGQAIRECDIFIACLSNKSVNRAGFVQKELRDALEVAQLMPQDSIFIIPVRLDNCQVPSNLSGMHWLNYFEAGAQEKLIDAIKHRKLPKGSRLKVSTGNGNGFSLQFLIEMIMGLLLPLFACIILSIAGVSRYYMEGLVANDYMEIVITSIIFFFLLGLSLFLFIRGVEHFTAAALGVGARIQWKEILNSIQKSLADREYFKAQLTAGKNLIQTYWTRENLMAPEFKERVKAAGWSLIFPGLGLYFRGRKLLGIGFLIATLIGYSELLPGILIHLIAIVLSGVLSKPTK